MRSLLLQFLLVAASALDHNVEGESLHDADPEFALVEHIRLGLEHHSHLDGLMHFCELVITAGQGKRGRHVVHRHASILDYPAVHTQPPTLLLISYTLVLVVQLRP